jgi:hypothetical protein
MKIFSTLRKGEEEFKWRGMTLVCIEPRAIPLRKSDVPTCPLDEVTIVILEYKYF